MAPNGNIPIVYSKIITLDPASAPAQTAPLPRTSRPPLTRRETQTDLRSSAEPEHPRRRRQSRSRPAIPPRRSSLAFRQEPAQEPALAAASQQPVPAVSPRLAHENPLASNPLLQDTRVPFRQNPLQPQRRLSGAQGAEVRVPFPSEEAGAVTPAEVQRRVAQMEARRSQMRLAREAVEDIRAGNTAGGGLVRVAPVDLDPELTKR